MQSSLNRRSFLKASANTGAVLGIGGLGSLAGPALVRAGDATRELIPIHPDIEPLVRLIHETPRERVVAMMIEQVRQGLSYRRFLTANFLAAIRYDLGGSHSVFVTHAVNQVGLDVRREDHFLPLFYHLGVLRSQDRTPYLWRVPDRELPTAHQADTAFRGAMEKDDQDASIRALLALARHEGPRRAFERLWPYAAERNLRSGGHTAVAVANAFRTLETVGWEHAEPVLQFLAYECRGRGGEGTPVCRENEERSRTVVELPLDWASRRGDRVAVLELVALFRKGAPEQVCRETYEQLRQGIVRAGDVWDAVFLTTAEFMIVCGNSAQISRSI